MNICLFNNLYPPINTGSSFITSQYAKYLKRNGHHVIVITNSFKDLTGYNVEDGIPVYRIPKISLPKLKLWMSFPDFNLSILPKNIRYIESVVRKEKIEILHQCNNIFDLVFASAHLKKKLKLPLVCSLMTPMQHTVSIYNMVLAAFDKIILKNYFAKRVNTYLALDRETLRYINERYSRTDGIELVPFTITQSFLDACRDTELNYEESKFTMISLGHVSNLKNRFETIRAWKIVTEKYPQAKLIIVGEIMSRDSADLIKELGLGNNIILTGRIPHERIKEFISQADISSMFLSGSLPYHRGVGVANLETMAYGLPTIVDISDDFFGSKFPLVDGENCVKLERRDPELFAAKIIELFEKPELRKKIGTNGKTFVHKTMLWENIIEELENVYKGLIEENNKSL